VPPVTCAAPGTSVAGRVPRQGSLHGAKDRRHGHGASVTKTQLELRGMRIDIHQPRIGQKYSMVAVDGRPGERARTLYVQPRAPRPLPKV